VISSRDQGVPDGVDITRPSIARVYDYLLGGKDNFAADRAVAEKLMASNLEPRRLALVTRDFLVRAVRFAAERGVDQFLDLGSGLPTAPSVHEVAREIIPGARVVYVDNDPVVVAHNRALLAIGDGLVTIQADVREPGSVLDSEETRECLDFDQPVALLLTGILHFIGDDDDPEAMIRRYRDALAPGSLLVLSTGTSDGADPAVVSGTREAYQGYRTAFRLRSGAEIERFFDGFDLVAPGLVSMQDWRPTEEIGGEPLKGTNLSGVGVKR
jgi:SAM-dependent methyltransferase